MNRIASASDSSLKFLTYQLSTVGYWPTVAMTGNGELGFDSGEAVKKLVVEILQVTTGLLIKIVLCFHWHKSDLLTRQLLSIRYCYFEKIRVFQAGITP